MKAEWDTSIRDPTGNDWYRGDDRPRMVDVGVGDGERTRRRREGSGGGGGGGESIIIGVVGPSIGLRVTGFTGFGVSDMRTSCHPC